jgi:hypothetical protein
MTDLTPRQILDAIDQALERVERRFAEARANATAAAGEQAASRTNKPRRKLVAAEWFERPTKG